MNYFDYEVRPELDDAGTYFYHSHVGFQYLLQRFSDREELRRDTVFVR